MCLKESVIRSAMSSLPHLRSCSPQHEAPPGQHDLLQDDTVHREHLPKTTGSESSSEEPLSHINYESARNLRPNTPTRYEPKEFATISGSALEHICQLFDVQREFGEQDQQAPTIEEVKEFGQIQGQGLVDHEMAETPLDEKMSYLQSQLHYDESMESIADSDLEDGELQKLMISPLCAQKASGKPDAMVVQERGKCTNVSFIRRSWSFLDTGCIVFRKM